jgi:hypothetical protein
MTKTKYQSERYWCAVACREHVKLGAAGGFAQVGHGRKQPLARMRTGDGIVYYSPTLRRDGGEKCQKFTSIGVVRDERIYQVEMVPRFKPFRRDIDYFAGDDALVHPLLPHLTFTRGRPNWGYRFRFGFFEIHRDDYVLILARMNPALCIERYGARDCGRVLAKTPDALAVLEAHA